MSPIGPQTDTQPHTVLSLPEGANKSCVRTFFGSGKRAAGREPRQTVCRRNDETFPLTRDDKPAPVPDSHNSLSVHPSSSVALVPDIFGVVGVHLLPGAYRHCEEREACRFRCLRLSFARPEVGDGCFVGQQRHARPSITEIKRAGDQTRAGPKPPVM